MPVNKLGVLPKTVNYRITEVYVWIFIFIYIYIYIYIHMKLYMEHSMMVKWMGENFIQSNY